MTSRQWRLLINTSSPSVTVTSSPVSFSVTQLPWQTDGVCPWTRQKIKGKNNCIRLTVGAGQDDEMPHMIHPPPPLLIYPLQPSSTPVCHLAPLCFLFWLLSALDRKIAFSKIKPSNCCKWSTIQVDGHAEVQTNKWKVEKSSRMLSHEFWAGQPESVIH